MLATIGLYELILLSEIENQLGITGCENTQNIRL